MKINKWQSLNSMDDFHNNLWKSPPTTSHFWYAVPPPHNVMALLIA